MTPERLAFITDRQWNYAAGRLESADEWLAREHRDLSRPATTEDVQIVMDEMRGQL